MGSTLLPTLSEESCPGNAWHSSFIYEHHHLTGTERVGENLCHYQELLRCNQAGCGSRLPCYLWNQLNKFSCGIINCTKTNICGIQHSLLCTWISAVAAPQQTRPYAGWLVFYGGPPGGLLKLNTVDLEHYWLRTIQLLGFFLCFKPCLACFAHIQSLQ